MSIDLSEYSCDDLHRMMYTNTKNLQFKSTTTQEEMKVKKWKHVAIFLVRILHVKNQVDVDISTQKAA